MYKDYEDNEETKKLKIQRGFREDYDENDRTIGKDIVNHDGKKYLVSTVDLGSNHQFGDGPGIYWETMVFVSGDWNDLYCDQYSSKEEAISGHAKVVELLKAGNLW